MLTIADTWKAAHPGAAAGALLMHHTANPERHPALEEKKALLPSLGYQLRNVALVEFIFRSHTNLLAG